MSLNAMLDPAIRVAAFTAIDATMHIVDTRSGAIAVTAPAGTNKRFLICDVGAGSGSALTVNGTSVRNGADPSALGVALYELTNASGAWVSQTNVYVDQVTRAALGRQLGLTTAYVPSGGSGGGGGSSARTMMIYWPSWGGSSTTILSKLPTYVTHLAIAFVQPDLTFNPASPVFEVAGPPVSNPTGLQFWDGWSPTQIKNSIAAIKAARPNLKVLLSVGGGTYNNWAPLATQGATATSGTVSTAGGKIQALYDLAAYLGVHGLDVDYEVFNASGTNVMAAGELSTYRNAIKACRAVSSAIDGVLTVSALHLGFETSSSYWWTATGAAGRERNVFADSAVAAMVDVLALQTYDVSLNGHWSPMKAYDQARAFFPNSVTVCAGLEGAPEGGGSNAVLVANDANTSSGVAVSWITNDQYGAAVNKPYSAQTIAGHVAANGQSKDGLIVWVGLRPGITTLVRSAVTALGLTADNATSLE
jgi:Glycosyl hydrolases family 18